MTDRTYQIRRPEARLIVHTQTKLPNPELLSWNDEKPPTAPYDVSKDLRSITTLNNLRNPGGAWTAELVYRKSRKGMSDEGEAALYKWINPMDVVEIQLNDSNQSTMVGIVEQVSKRRTVSSSGVTQGIRLTGRSLGSIWMRDTLKFFPMNIVAGEEGEIAVIGKLPANFKEKVLSDLRYTKIKGEFYGKSPIKLIEYITDKLSSIDIEYADGKRIRDFIDAELTVEDEDIKTFTKAGYTFQGSIWRLLEEVSAKPFYELFTDSRDGKLFLRFRPTPFNRDSWNNLNTWLDGFPYHIIPDRDVVSENLKRSPDESYSIFHVSSIGSPWLSFKESSEYGLFPPVLDPELYKALGLRVLAAKTSLLPLDIAGNIGEGIRDEHRKYRNRLYLWYKDNHRFERGTIMIKGNDRIRIGERLLLGEGSRAREFYIEEVSHNWIQGGNFTSTINITRGANQTNRNKWLEQGQDYLQEIGQS